MSEPDVELSPKEQFWRFYQTSFWMHIAFVVASIAVVACSMVMTSEGRTTVRIPGMAVPMPETCMSRRLWGMDCPGCGLTRSFINMGHGEFSKAFSFNRAGPIIYLFVLAQIPWHSYQAFRLYCYRRPVESAWLFVPLYGMSALVLIQWIYRIAQEDEFWIRLN